MHVALIGVAGRVGSRLATEFLSRFAFRETLGLPWRRAPE
jgi:putative NADH-flavin reductase